MLLAFNNLLRHKLRTLMTIAGVAAGVALYVALNSVTASFKQQISSIGDTWKVDLAIQSQGAPTPLSSRIPPEAYRRLADLPEVDKLALVSLSTLKTPWNPYLVIIGISAPEMFAGHIRLVKGELFTPGADEILIGTEILRAGYDVNRRIALLNNETFKITGVFASEIKLLNAAVMIDFQTAQRLLKRNDAVNMVFIRLAPGIEQQDMAARIETLMPALQVMPVGTLVNQIYTVRLVETMFLLIAALAFIAVCIVIANTLLMAITERTREIGVLMAIGWSRSRITRLILAESLIICMVGMLVGNVGGYAILKLLHTINPEGMGWWITAALHGEIFLKTVVIALLLGTLSAAYPIWVATRLNPVQALRYE